jgi:hypothetical protein
MRELLLSIASPGSLSWAGFLILALGLLGEVAILVIPAEKQFWHNILALVFAAVVLVGYLIGHIGDDEIAARFELRATNAELQLEKLKQPRLLSEGQISRIASKVREFSGTRFDAAVVPGDPEAIIFLTHITATLESAGWMWIEFNPPTGPLAMVYTFAGKPNIGQLGWFGVTLIVHPDHASKISKSANALGAALIAEGFEVTLDVVENVSIPNKDTVHVIVGKKRP